MSTMIEPKYDIGDRVRVVSSASNFFGWTGEITARYNGDFEFGVIHYHVKLDGFAVAFPPPLLFRQIELAASL